MINKYFKYYCTSPPPPVPVHEEDGQWYFWDETWASRYGPYKTESIANNELEDYCKYYLGNNNIELIRYKVASIFRFFKGVIL
jgi:hypothetical protein